jgi:hypothetical protein
MKNSWAIVLIFRWRQTNEHCILADFIFSCECQLKGRHTCWYKMWHLAFYETLMCLSGSHTTWYKAWHSQWNHELANCSAVVQVM